MSYALEPMTVAELQQFVGLDFATKFNNEIEPVVAPLRKYVNMGRSIALDKSIWEYFVTDSIPGAKWCGAGKGIADVQIGLDTSIDVKSLYYKGSTTTEASMCQRLLTGESAGMYNLFDPATLFDLLVTTWLHKVSGSGNYYLLAIVKDQNMRCSLIGMKVSNTNIIFDPAAITSLKASIVVNNLIDPKLAQVKLYRGKTRMEIRFRKSFFLNPAYSYNIWKGI